MTDLAYSTAGFTRHVTHVDGIDCVWYEIGAGRPTVYFHGGGTFHGFDWARDWAGECRVILPHHPNFGESGDADFNSIADYADFHARFFDLLGLQSLDLVGASMGGYFAATHALRHPARIRKLVLVSPAGLQSPAAPMPDFAAIPPAEIPALFVHDPAWIAPYWPAAPSPAWLALRGREAGAVARARGDNVVGNATLRAALPKLSAPTLIIWGEDDHILPLPLIEEWRGVMPSAQIEVIPNGGHLLLDEFPQSRQVVLDFLRD